MFKFNGNVKGFMFDDREIGGSKTTRVSIYGEVAHVIITGVGGLVVLNVTANLNINTAGDSDVTIVDSTGVKYIDDVLKALQISSTTDNGIVKPVVVGLSYRTLEKNNGKMEITVDFPEGTVIPFHKVLGDALYAEDVCDVDWNVVGTNYIFQIGAVSYPIDINGNTATIDADAADAVIGLINKHGYTYKGGRFTIEKL